MFFFLFCTVRPARLLVHHACVRACVFFFLHAYLYACAHARAFLREFLCARARAFECFSLRMSFQVAVSPAAAHLRGYVTGGLGKQCAISFSGRRTK